MSKRRKQHCFWSSMVVLTIIVCGAVLYASYIYEGNHMAPCENCNDMSEILQEKLSQEECQRICYSKECVVAANFILENMDATADPCEDFYTFSCGKWMRQFSKEDNYSVVDGMTTTLQLTLKDVLEKSKGTPGSTEEKLKIMFDSCMDERASEWNSKSEARKFLEKFGIRNWPNLPNDFQFNVSLDETLSIMAAFNEFAFVTFKPTYDEPQESLADNNFRKLTISPGYPLMRDESESDVYEAVLLGILRHFGASSEDADEIWTEFKTIDFSLLSLLMETSAKVRYGEDEQELLEPLNCLASVEDSMSLTCRVLAKFTEFSNISRRYSGRIAYMEREHYVQNIFSHVTNFTQKSVGNYLALRFIINHQRDLNGFLRALGAELPDVYPLDRNRKGIVPKWEYCTRWMSHYMSYPLGQLYVREVLPEKHMDEIRNVVRIFIYDAGVYVMKQRWVKKHLRRRLKTLIDNIKNSFEDYVRTLRNETKLGLYMDEFSPTSENFLRNVMEYRKLTFQFYLLNHRALEDAEFPAEPFIVNAYHSPGILDLRFGIFLPPVYQYGRPKLLNFATMGTTLGHELGHEIEAFMEEVENYDNDTCRIYKEKKKCLVEQYSEFQIKKIGKKVKGNQTIHENLADLIGIEITQQIITRFLLRGNFSLPALNFTTEQLLYISLAQMWCSVSSWEKEQLHYELDIHAPSDIRIIGMLRNLREFSNAFNCPRGSRMNPAERCAFRLRS